MPWLEATMWRLTRSLHDRCEMVFCPSESTRRMLRSKGFSNVEIWSRGVDTEIFTVSAAAAEKPALVLNRASCSLRHETTTCAPAGAARRSQPA
jgi:hypothetical protein